MYKRQLCTVVFFPVILIGMVVGGLIYIALPLLIIGGIKMCIRDSAYTININHKEVHLMLLNEIINEVGRTKRAVKYYEEKGLLSVDKDNNGYRNYTCLLYTSRCV